MTRSRTSIVSRTATVSAAFVLAFGAAGVAASAAFADGTTPVAPVSASVQDEPTFTLVDNGAGSFSLAIVIPGTSVAIDYTVDATGAVTTATTSTAGAVVGVNGDELTVTLADGRVVAVEIGEAGKVDEVDVEGPDDNSADDNSADDNHADDSSADDNGSADNSADDNGSADNSADDNSADDNSGADNSGDDSADSAPDSGDSGDDSGDSAPDSGDSGSDSSDSGSSD